MNFSERIKKLIKELGSSKEDNAMQMPADVQKLNSYGRKHARS